MRRIALLVPNPDRQSTAQVWPGILATYRALFAAHGTEIVPVPWNEAATISDVAGVVPLLAWGYHFDEKAWRHVLAALSPRLPVVNDVTALLWNTRKSYLESMREAGVCVVPTLFAERVDAGTLSAAFDQFQTDELVVKPAVSGGGYLTSRVRRGEVAPQLNDAMVQPFLPSIVEEGEASLVFFGGEYSHALRKVPACGDFRVQFSYGGTYAPFEPGEEALQTSVRAIQTAPAALAYARVDLVRLPDGRLAVIELEAIEPEMFLQFAPEGGARLVSSIAREIEKHRR
jgi:glutathione synthase/RimK-type ligase-like ATP-grasp enzyme